MEGCYGEEEVQDALSAYAAYAKDSAVNGYSIN